MQETLDAIAKADLITLGPGSLFTSIIPNLLVKGIAEAIQESPAIKLCFMNLMWQPGETIEYKASDHIEAIQEHAADKADRCCGGQHGANLGPSDSVNTPESARCLSRTT